MNPRPFVLITIIVHNVERKLERERGEAEEEEEEKSKRAGCNLAASKG